MMRLKLIILALIIATGLLGSCTSPIAQPPSGSVEPSPSVVPSPSPSTSPVAPTAAPTLPPLQDNTNSALGITISNISFWENQCEMPFVNLAKAAIWYGPDWSDLPSSNLTSNGYLKVGSDGKLVVIYNSSYYTITGCNLVVTYTGTATFTPVGASVVSNTPGRLVVTIPAKANTTLWFSITNHTSQLNNIRITEDFNESNPNLFRKAFLDEWKYFKTINFSDLMPVVDTEIQNIGVYPENDWLPDSKNASLSTMVNLCNILHANAWLSIPFYTTDAQANQIANYFHANLNSDLKVYVEFTTNSFLLSQGGRLPYKQIIDDETTKIVGDRVTIDKSSPCNINGYNYDEVIMTTNNPFKGQVYVGYRHGSIHSIFDSVFGADKSRIVHVLNSGLSYNPYYQDMSLLLYGYLMNRSQLPDILVAPPFIIGDPIVESTHEQVSTWSTSQLFSYISNALKPDYTYTTQFSFVDTVGNTIKRDIVNQGLFLRTRDWAVLAKKLNIRLACASLGTSFSNEYDNGFNNDPVTPLFIAANRDHQMKAIYSQLLDLWKATGGAECIITGSTGQYSKWGCYTIKENSTDTLAQSPKYDASLQWIYNNPKWY